MAAIDGTISVRVELGDLVEAVFARGRDRRDDHRRRVDVERGHLRLDVLGQAGVGEVLLDLGLDASSTSVPNENWATTRRDRVRGGRLERLEARHAGDGALDRLGDLLGDVLGAGARVRGDDRDDRELDVRQELLLEAAPGRDARR